MNSVFGARKQLEEIPNLSQAVDATAPVTMSPNIELQDLGDLEAGNQDDIQDDPDEAAEDPAGELSELTVKIKLAYAKLKLGAVLLGLNVWIVDHLHNSYIAMSATSCHLLRTFSCILSAMSAVFAVHTMQMRLPSGRWTRYVWLSLEALLLTSQVLVTISAFA